MNSLPTVFITLTQILGVVMVVASLRHGIKSQENFRFPTPYRTGFFICLLLALLIFLMLVILQKQHPSLFDYSPFLQIRDDISYSQWLNALTITLIHAACILNLRIYREPLKSLRLACILINQIGTLGIATSSDYSSGMSALAGVSLLVLGLTEPAKKAGRALRATIGVIILVILSNVSFLSQIAFDPQWWYGIAVSTLLAACFIPSEPRRGKKDGSLKISTTWLYCSLTVFVALSSVGGAGYQPMLPIAGFWSLAAIAAMVVFSAFALTRKTYPHAAHYAQHAAVMSVIATISIMGWLMHRQAVLMFSGQDVATILVLTLPFAALFSSCSLHEPSSFAHNPSLPILSVLVAIVLALQTWLTPLMLILPELTAHPLHTPALAWVIFNCVRIILALTIIVRLVALSGQAIANSGSGIDCSGAASKESRPAASWRARHPLEKLYKGLSTRYTQASSAAFWLAWECALLMACWSFVLSLSWMASS